MCHIHPNQSTDAVIQIEKVKRLNLTTGAAES